MSTIKKILLASGVVVIVAAVFAAGYFGRGYQDKQQQEAVAKTASTFIQDLVAGKNAEAYAMTSKSLQASQKQSDFATALGDLKSDKPTFKDPLYIQKDGTYYYSQRVLNLPKTPTGSTTGSFMLILKQESGSWKVTNVSVQ